MKNKPLVFNPKVAKEKPNNNSVCPFCNTDTLTNVLATDGNIIWLDNKYPTIEDTYQTVIIESSDHNGDISSYTYEHNRKLFRFSISHWLETIASEKFETVILFKNFGPLSGGSLRHPHMQIVDLNHTDAYKNVIQGNFLGLKILDETFENAEINISLDPIMGYSEFNIIISDSSQIDFLADGVKEVTNYLLGRYFDGRCTSYNLFFYLISGKYICKVVPRFIASPFFVGYKLSQISNDERLKTVKEEFLENRSNLRKSEILNSFSN